jgi:hypothetical protein
LPAAAKQVGVSVLKKPFPLGELLAWFDQVSGGDAT